MRTPKARCQGLWEEIETYRKEHRLPQTQMAHLLGITKSAYGNEVTRHKRVPTDVWKRYKTLLALPKPEENKQYVLIAWNGNGPIVLDEPTYQKDCSKCGIPFVTINLNRKLCGKCK